MVASVIGYSVNCVQDKGVETAVRAVERKISMVRQKSLSKKRRTSSGAERYTRDCGSLGRLGGPFAEKWLAQESIIVHRFKQILKHGLYIQLIRAHNALLPRGPYCISRPWA